MRLPLHTHSIPARLLDADPHASLSQIIVRAHLGVQGHPAYCRGEREPLLRSLPGSRARAQSARAWLRLLCALAVLCVSLSGVQVAYACTLLSHMCAAAATAHVSCARAAVTAAVCGSAARRTPAASAARRVHPPPPHCSTAVTEPQLILHGGYMSVALYNKQYH